MWQRGDEAGQAAVLAALCLFTCVVFLALASNTGILVNDRLRMQNTADLSAYAGALEQARSLNEMAQTNLEIWQTINECRHVLATTNWTQCDDCECNPHEERDAEAYIADCVARIEALANHFVEVNRSAPRSAYLAALNTAGGNMPGTDRGDHFSNFEQNESSPTYWKRTGLIVVERFTEVRINYQFNYCCRSSGGYCALVYAKHPSKIQQWDGWFYKVDPVGDMVYFPTRVSGTPAGGYLDLPRTGGATSADEEYTYFLSDAIGGRDPLKAYAVAKPYEGNIGPDWDTSEEWGNVLQGWVYDHYSAAPLQPYFQPTYRARIAGLHEPLFPPAVDLIAREYIEAGERDPSAFFTH